jgi:hypothetical protein
MKTVEQITETLEALSDSELFDLWNEYCAEISNSNTQVFYFNDDFFTKYFSDPGEAARATFFGDIKSWNDTYIQFNGYGNLESSNYLSELISIYDLANHIEANQEEYDNILDAD